MGTLLGLLVWREPETCKEAKRGRPLAKPPRVQEVIQAIDEAAGRRAQIKSLAKEVGQDHSLAQQLWKTGSFPNRLFATLIFDKKELSQAALEEMAQDLESQTQSERNQISDWLLANQLRKSKATVALLEGWIDHPARFFGGSTGTTKPACDGPGRTFPRIAPSWSRSWKKDSDRNVPRCNGP